ncbi:MAG: hypothetical protein RQ875_09485, partial [Vicingaceae bacterium]|nr:hypothetical protein [Vicingaceae bacterium]
GGLPEKHFKYITQVIPILEKDIKNVMNAYDNRVVYEKIANDSTGSLFAKCMRVYCQFYEQQTELKPKIDGTEGNALKKIVAYLNELTVSEDEAFAVWCQLLHNWKKQEEFYRKQLLIRQINSNLPILLNQLKENATGQTQAHRDADAARQSI